MQGTVEKSIAVYASLESDDDVDVYTFTVAEGERVQANVLVPQCMEYQGFYPALALVGPGLPDPEQPLPQWLCLEFPESREFNAVYLTFDTDMNRRSHDVPLVPQCVRDYELSFDDGTEWITLVKETGNFQRRRLHRFDPVTASQLKLTVHATCGAPSARLFEIRVYNEQTPQGGRDADAIGASAAE
jgi:hypothetical protein